MGLRARSIAVAGLVVAAMIGPLGAADAAAQRPVQAPLLNAAGEPSGCTVRIGAPFQFMANDGLREGSGITLVCDSVWTRVRMKGSEVEVLPDGTVPVKPLTDVLFSPGNNQLTLTVRGTWLCSSTPGTHEYVWRAQAKVSTGRNDPNVYVANVERRATFTCPG